jgi:uncharacterized Zn finger protein
MLQWQHLFSTAILQRGREYYKKNKVRSLIQDGDLYYASVEGTEEYEVQIRIQGDRVDFMSCECGASWRSVLCVTPLPKTWLLNMLQQRGAEYGQEARRT